MAAKQPIKVVELLVEGFLKSAGVDIGSLTEEEQIQLRTNCGNQIQHLWQNGFKIRPRTPKQQE